MPASTGWCRSAPRKARNDPDLNLDTPRWLRAQPASTYPGNSYFERLQYSPVVASTGRVTRSQINGCGNDFNKQEKPMSTSSTIADSSAPSRTTPSSALA